LVWDGEGRGNFVPHHVFREVHKTFPRSLIEIEQQQQLRGGS
jgi:hypothetical protein